MRPTEHGEYSCIVHIRSQLTPFQGEVYVLNDGGEVDLDLGNYERYLDVTLSRDNNITTGKIYKEVIEKEVGLPCLLKLTLMHNSAKENIWARQYRQAHCYAMISCSSEIDCSPRHKRDPRLD